MHSEYEKNVFVYTHIIQTASETRPEMLCLYNAESTLQSVRLRPNTRDLRNCFQHITQRSSLHDQSQ